MKLVKHTEWEVTIQLHPTNVKQLLKQMEEFPDSDNWIFSLQDGVHVKIEVKE